MSLLEDVFLEDEAGEAQDLERVIEGGDYDERPLSPNSDDNEEREDEAEEDKRRVDPKQPKAVRVVKNPRFILNPARLTGPRGFQVIPDHFKDFKFKGKGYEKEDLDMVLKKLEHWAYRLYPKFEFKDCLKKIEMLGKKRPVMVHLHKIRSDQLMSEETVVQKDSSDDDEPPQVEDEFDKLLQQQIDLARSTPAPGSIKKPPYTPSVDHSISMPKATSSPSFSEEQRDRMLKNRQLAEERRLAKLKNDSSLNEKNDVTKHADIVIEGITELSNEIINKKQTRHNVIDSSDDEEITVNKSITVDIHKKMIENDDIFNKKSFDNDMQADVEAVQNQYDETNIENKSKENNDASTMNINSIESMEELIVNNVSEINTTNDIIAQTNHETNSTSTTNSINITKDSDENNEHDKTDSIKHNDKHFDNADSNLVANKENLDRNIEDIMDVDFVEDF